MRCVNQYSTDYIVACRSRMEAQLAAYKRLASAKEKAGVGKAAVEAFEKLFFANLVVVLESSFVHRARGQEGKNGNPLNEVRMLCNSILQNRGVLAADTTIKYQPGTSVLKLQIGDEINLSEANFVPLFRAFFAEIENKFR